jgi:hypothetical protein
MDYSVVKKIDISKAGLGWKIGQYVYFQDIDAIYFKAPYPFPVEIMVSEGLSKCQVTPMFLKLPFLLKGWINSDILLRLIDVMKLALMGVLFLHASCVGETLIVGFPNSGKTWLTFKMLQMGGELISEEYTLIENGWATPYKPMTRTCVSNKTIEDCGVKISWMQRIHLFFTTIRAKLMPFMFEDVIWTKLQTCGKPAKVKRIVYGSTGREVKNWKDLAILTENEFPFMASDFLQAYAICTGFDILNVQEKQRAKIKEFVESVYVPEHTVTKP